MKGFSTAEVRDFCGAKWAKGTGGFDSADIPNGCRVKEKSRISEVGRWCHVREGTHPAGRETTGEIELRMLRRPMTRESAAKSSRGGRHEVVGWGIPPKMRLVTVL